MANCAVDPLREANGIINSFTMDLFNSVFIYGFGFGYVTEATLRLNIGSGGWRINGMWSVDRYADDIDFRMDIASLGFQDNSVDIIHSCHALEHLPEILITEILQEWFRVLKKNGTLVLNLPDLLWDIRYYLLANRFNDFRNEKGIEMIFGHQKDEGNFHKTGFSKPKLHMLLKGAGFREIKIQSIISHKQKCLYTMAKK